MSQLFDKFSSRENLKKAYSYVLKGLANSSLSINPVNHPATTAIDEMGDDFFVALEQYLRDGKYKPEKGFFVYVPKDNLGLRPVCIPSMIDQIVYQAILNQAILGHKIDSQLSDKVCFANRVSENEDDEDFLNYYSNGWDNFCKGQKRSFKDGYTWKLEVDVQQYYESISIKRLMERLTEDFGIRDEVVVGILEKQLGTWTEYPEFPKGIPQGPEASAVLANAYLSSLDDYVEREFSKKELCYFRYNDDITLMGKSREVVLKATEKIVRFLRENNLTLNEKTRLSELDSAETIEAMRFFSEYEEEDTPEIPDDDFSEIQNEVPFIINALQDGERVEKSDIKKLKYFLKIDTNYGDIFMMQLIELIPSHPSFTVHIVRYISEGRKALDDFDASMVDDTLWKTYLNPSVSEWSRFWILKLLVSNKDVWANGIEKEVEKILSSKESAIFKIVCFYYQTIQEKIIDIEQIKQAVSESKTDLEKSLYSFFFQNAFQEVRGPVIKSCIEKLINSPSQEVNLIGSYLFKNRPNTKIEEFNGDFSRYLLKKPKKKVAIKKGQEKEQVQQEFFIVRSESLIPFTSPSSILGVSRNQRKKHTVELIFPEIVRWEKVEMKLKEGMNEIEIFYNKNFIACVDYKQLGFFTGKKQEKPDRQWGFLCALSALFVTDLRLATADKMCTMVAINSKVTLKVGNVHQIKKTLVRRLRSLFKTSDNPFYDNRFYYHPKFTILPEPVLRQEEIWPQVGRLNENLPYEDDETY